MKKLVFIVFLLSADIFSAHAESQKKFRLNNCMLSLPVGYINPWLSPLKGYEKNMDISGRWFAFNLASKLPIEYNLLRDPSLLYISSESIRSYVIRFQVTSNCPIQRTEREIQERSNEYTDNSSGQTEVDRSKYFKLQHFGEKYVARFFCSPMAGPRPALNPLCSGRVENIHSGLKFKIRFPATVGLVNSDASWLEAVHAAEKLFASWQLHGE